MCTACVCVCVCVSLQVVLAKVGAAGCSKVPYLPSMKVEEGRRRSKKVEEGRRRSKKSKKRGKKDENHRHCARTLLPQTADGRLLGGRPSREEDGAACTLRREGYGAALREVWCRA